MQVNKNTPEHTGTNTHVVCFVLHDKQMSSSLNWTLDPGVNLGPENVTILEEKSITVRGEREQWKHHCVCLAVRRTLQHVCTQTNTSTRRGVYTDPHWHTPTLLPFLPFPFHIITASLKASSKLHICTQGHAGRRTRRPTVLQISPFVLLFSG